MVIRFSFIPLNSVTVSFSLLSDFAGNLPNLVALAPTNGRGHFGQHQAGHDQGCGLLVRWANNCRLSGWPTSVGLKALIKTLASMV